MNTTRADAIEAFVVDAYSTGLKGSNGKPQTHQGEGTVLAAIVALDGTTQAPVQVLSMGMGTRSVGTSNIVDSRFVLSDGHAEVMCRRAFLALLVQGAADLLKEKVLSNEFLEVHQPIGDDGTPTTVVRWRKEKELVLYISHPPCGAASIFGEGEGNKSTTGAHQIVATPDMNFEETLSLQLLEATDTTAVGGHHLLSHGKDLELQIPDALRVKPGKGTPSLNMCCSDKITKWAQLGIQGSVVGLLMQDPIKIKQYVLSGQICTEKAATSLQRALHRGTASDDLHGFCVSTTSGAVKLPWLPDEPAESKQQPIKQQVRMCGSSVAAWIQGLPRNEQTSAVCKDDLLAQKRSRHEVLPSTSQKPLSNMVVVNSKLGVPLGMTQAAVAKAAKESSEDLIQKRSKVVSPISRLALCHAVAACLDGGPQQVASQSYAALKESNVTYQRRKGAFLKTSRTPRQDPAFSLWVQKGHTDFQL